MQYDKSNLYKTKYLTRIVEMKFAKQNKNNTKREKRKQHFTLNS